MKSLILNQFQNITVHRSRIKRVGIFALLFALVKANSVASVFILSNLSPSIELFGSIDYALALGLILCMPLNAGLPGAYPYFILKLRQLKYESVFYFHGWLLSFMCLLLLSVFYVFNIPVSITHQLILIIASIFSLQILASVMFKSRENIFKALIFEGGFFLLLNGYNIYLVSFNKLMNPAELSSLWTAYLFLLNGYYLWNFIKLRKFDWVAYMKVLHFGLPLIMGSLLIVCLTGSARILIEHWIDIKAVGIYGLYFRLAAVIVLIYQVINIAFFKKIYTIKPEKLDQWFQYLLLFIIAVSITSTLLIPGFVLPYFELLSSTWKDHKALYVTLNFQMFFWIIIALFENIIYRENLSGKCNPGLIALFCLMLTTVAVIHGFGQLDLLMLTGVNALCLYLAAEWQLFLLCKKTLNFSKSKYLLRFSSFSLIFYLINHLIF